MHLTLHLTSRCNLRCRYCYAAPHGTQDMSLETARSAIALAARHTAAGSESIGIVFYGGEPLLCRELIGELIRHCRMIGQASGTRFHFQMTTNGVLLDRGFLDDADTGRVFVALSHDGVRQAHDACRLDCQGQGTFSRLEQVIPMLLARRPYAPAMLVVTPATAPWYAASVEYLFGKGFRYIMATLDYGADWKAAHLAELGRQYHRLASWYERASRREDKFFFSPFELKIASHVHPGGVLRERCELATRQLSVAPDGTLYPCVQFACAEDPGWALGHVARGIDEQQRARLARYRTHEEQECKSCALQARCHHHCGCVNYRTTGHAARVSPVVCAHERLLIPVVDALAERLFRRRDPMFLQKHYNEYYPVVSAAEDSSLVPLRSGAKGRRL